MLIFDCFKSNYDDTYFVPGLADKWLTPVELAMCQKLEQSQRQAAASQDGVADPQRAPDHHEDEEPSQPTPSQRASSSQRAPDAPSQRAPDPTLPPDDLTFEEAIMEEPVEPPAPPLRRSTQIHKPSPRYAQHGAVVVKSYCAAMVSALILTSGQAYDNRYQLNLLLDRDFGLYENLGADTLMCHPQAMTASTSHDPDPPRLHEAMDGEYCEDFLVAMGKETEELESHGTWSVLKKTSLPSEASNLLPSTWAFKIK
jgi:hypothetical protein